MPPYDDKLFSVYVGNLHANVTEELLYELFLQVGPLRKVCIPKDPLSGQNKNFGFITFRHEVSVPYAIDLLQGVPLFGKYLNLKKRHTRRDTTENKETSVNVSQGGVMKAFNNGKELVNESFTKVLSANARGFNSGPMEIRTSSPLHLKHFNATHRERGMRVDAGERSFNPPVARVQSNLSYRSSYVTPQRQMTRNNIMKVPQNIQRVSQYGAPIDVMPQRHPMVPHCNQPFGNPSHKRNGNGFKQDVRERQHTDTRHHPYKSRSFY